MSRKAAGWGGLLLLAVIAAAYYPALRAGFVWDDNSVLTANRLIQANDGLRRFWFTAEPTDYWPVSSTTLWIEWRLWGMNALGYHAMNLLWHAAACGLIWAVLRRLSVPGAYIAALLFAVHPVNVESVAWIAERKNLVAMVFSLLAVWFFLGTGIFRGGRRPPGDGNGRGDDAHRRPEVDGHPRNNALNLGFSLAAFILALLSKGSVAMLPLVLAGIVASRRRLAWRDLPWLAPYLAAAVLFATVDVWFQKHYLTEAIRRASLAERLAGVGPVVWFYLSKAVAPFRLVFVYPRWTIHAAAFATWLPLLAALGLGGFLWRACRPAFWPWAYFGVMLVPVAGLTDVYFMRYSLVADHYQHLALIGVCALVARASVSQSGRAGRLGPPVPTGGPGRAALPFTKRLRVPLRVLAVVVLGALTWRQCLMYRDPETLYRAVLRDNPNAGLARNNLGNLLRRSGHLAEAIGQYQAALRIDPGDSDAHNNLGNAFLESGRYEAAARELEEAVRLNPGIAEAHYNLGNTLARLGRVREAEGELETALRIAPLDPDAHNNLGMILLGEHRFDAAVDELRAAVRLAPASAGAHENLGTAYIQTGRLAEAEPEFAAALRLRPGDLEARNNLGNLLLQAGRPEEAREQFEAVLRVKPRSAETRNSLGNLYLAEGRLAEAVAQYRGALEANPQYAEAHNNLGVALSRAGRLEEAVGEFEEALRCDPDLPDAQRNLRRARALLARRSGP